VNVVTASDAVFPDDDSVAVTVVFALAAAADAVQISDVPRCEFTRRTSDHVRPPPDTVAV